MHGCSGELNFMQGNIVRHSSKNTSTEIRGGGRGKNTKRFKKMLRNIFRKKVEISFERRVRKLNLFASKQSSLSF